MATARDCEGNIISPLGSFKHLPIVSTVSTPSNTSTLSEMSKPVPVDDIVSSHQTPIVSTPTLTSPVNIMSPFPTVTTLHFRSSFFPSTTLTTQTKDKPVVSSVDLEIVLPVKREPASKVIITEEFVDQQNNAIPSPSPLAKNWIDLLLQLRRDTGQQLKELQAAVREKDKKLISQLKHIKKLDTSIASLVHDDNMDHLSRQQSMTSCSSSDGDSVSSQSSPFSSRNQHRSVPSRSEAADNVETRRRQDQTDFISRIGAKVDTLAMQYSPDKYDCVVGTNHSSTKVHDDPDNLVDPVPRELFAIWFCQGDLTEEEEEKFDMFMEAENRPPVIHSPSFAKPRVNWMKVNKWQLRNLPEPELFPVHSVPQDPDYYGTAYVKEYVERHGGLFGCMGVPKGCGCIRCNPPFGRCSGLRTNHGIIGMPTEPVHGYVWSGSDGWVLYAGGSYG